MIIESWYLEHHNPADNKHKFYRVTVLEVPQGYEVVFSFGRIGTKGQNRSKGIYDSSVSARSKAVELVSKKEHSNRDQYELLEHSQNTPETVPQPSPKKAHNPLTGNRRRVITNLTPNVVQLCTEENCEFVLWQDLPRQKSDSQLELFDVVTITDSEPVRIVDRLGKYYSDPSLCQPDPCEPTTMAAEMPD